MDCAPRELTHACSRSDTCSRSNGMGLYDVPMFMSLFGFGIGMMFASFHV